MKTKTILFTLLAFSLLIVGIISCENEDIKKDIELKEYVHSQCKDNTKRVNNFSKDAPKMLEEYILYKATKDGYLVIQHVNTEFNCCPDTILTDISSNNGEITISSREKVSGCKCLCKYDLNYKVGSLANEKYTFIINKNNKPYFKFSIDYNPNIEGKITIKKVEIE